MVFSIQRWQFRFSFIGISYKIIDFAKKSKFQTFSTTFFDTAKKSQIGSFTNKQTIFFKSLTSKSFLPLCMFMDGDMKNNYSWEATATLVPVCKRGVCKRGILKSLVSYFLNFKNWIKLIYDTVDKCNFIINELNSIFEVQNMGNEAFQNASFGNTLFPIEVLYYSYRWSDSSQ